MQVTKIETTNKFEELTEDFRTLNVWNFGPLMDLEGEDEGIEVLTGSVNGETVAYLIAQDNELWHIETKQGFNGNGYAKQLVIEAKIDFVNEVCSDEGVEFCEALNLDYEDCR